MRRLIQTTALAAAASLALAPVAAQAGTRAESAPVTVDVQRAGQPGAEENALGLASPLLLLLLISTVAAIVLALTGRSRGA